MTGRSADADEGGRSAAEHVRPEREVTRVVEVFTDRPEHVDKVVERVITVTQVRERLLNIELDPWGPEGVRYVCFLIWDSAGFRHLANTFGVDDWERWDASSGSFWDLFLAGCSGDPHAESDTAIPAEDWRPLAAGDARSFFWSERAARSLAQQITAIHSREAKDGSAPWKFTGPIELVAVGARSIRRRETDKSGRTIETRTVEFDWGSLRSAIVEPHQLPDAVTHYTQSHVDLDVAALTGGLPTPGAFDKPALDPAIKSAISRAITSSVLFVGKLIWSSRGGAA